KVKFPDSDDDDDLRPARSGSRAGLWIAILSLLVIAGAATVVYLFAFRDKKPAVVEKPPADAAQVVLAKDAAPVVTPLVDAPPPPTPLETARGELTGDVETRMKTALDTIGKLDEPP